MKTLNIGLVGCGVMGSGLAKALSGIDGANLAVVCDPVKDAAKGLGEELGVPYTDDLEKVLGRKRIHGIIGAPPPFKHREVAVAAAKAGKHVFIEKPFAANLKDCDAIIRAVRRAKIKLMVGQVCRFHPFHRKIRDMVAEGSIGDPVFMHVYRIGGGWGGIWAKSWRMSRKMSGGTLLEVNAHEIDFMRFVCGDIKSVFAAGGIYKQTEADYPDLAAVTMNFASGAVGFLHSSQVSAIGGYGGRIDGTEGSLNFPSIWGDGSGIHFRKSDGSNGFIPAADLTAPDPVQLELSAWLDSIRHDTEPPIPGSEGRAVVEIAEAAYESIETGKVVELR